MSALSSCLRSGPGLFLGPWDGHFPAARGLHPLQMPLPLDFNKQPD